jgi:hypothetical protein
MPINEDEWGALPEELARYRQLKQTLEKDLVIDPDRRVIVQGVFRPALPPDNEHLVGVLRRLEVQWRADAQ